MGSLRCPVLFKGKKAPRVCSHCVAKRTMPTTKQTESEVENVPTKRHKKYTPTQAAFKEDNGAGNVQRRYGGSEKHSDYKLKQAKHRQHSK